MPRSTATTVSVASGRGQLRALASAAMRPDVAMLLGFAAIDAVWNLLAFRFPLSAWGREFAFSIVEFGPALILARLWQWRFEVGRPLPLSGLVLGTAAVATFAAVIGAFRLSPDWRTLASAWLGSSLPCALLVATVQIQARAVRAQARAHEAQQGIVRLEAELQEARARLLEAQIEPHFLFNALANVRQLARTDRSAGIEMLTDLIEYLETSLPSLRSQSSTLEQERALLAAYLRLHRPRFGRRLRFDISFPEALRSGTGSRPLPRVAPSSSRPRRRDLSCWSRSPIPERAWAPAAAAARGCRMFALRWISVLEGRELRFVTTEEILFFRSDHKYTAAVTREREHLVSRSLKQLVEELDPETFWRVHRSYVVNLWAILSVRRMLGGGLEIVLRDYRERIPVSQPYAHRFRHM